MTTRTPPLVLSDTPFRMPTDVELDDRVRVVEMRHTDVTLDDLPALFDGGFAVLSGLGPIGPGYAIYDGEVSGSFELTIGFPIAGPAAMSLVPVRSASVPADLPDGVMEGTFPTGTALVVSHLGSFEGLGAVWQRLGEHPQAQGRTRVIEIYVTDPSQTEVEELRTDLVIPLS
ncbi:GyrI-like domain-containing protein [Nocardioides alcanivorans]|uniref:GyrI-like domain-containing protein n=1 Tax=Nocardioides alcanivorans TaxID=2897352 RepID=UPI001F3083B6|nr:GyrI-like domain-containing protein [Nocardioides alcanivorans]